MHALHSSNYELLGQSLKDVIIEPRRSQSIPNFDALKKISLESAALGCTISGSGPSVFSLCRGSKIAAEIQKAQVAFMKETDIEFETHISKINTRGIKILS